MGYIRHHAIIVTSSDDERLDLLREHAADLMPGLVTDIVGGEINGYRSFFIAPDGSNEGWPDSDLGELRRGRFVDWLRSFDHVLGNPFDWALVQYGDDDGDDQLLDASGLHLDEFPDVPESEGLLLVEDWYRRYGPPSE